MRYTKELKKQIVMLYNNGKSASEIMEEFNVSSSALYKWIKNYNRTAEENEVIELRKKVNQLEMEVDILKQADLIIGKK